MSGLLDDPARHARFDPGAMHDIIAGFPGQLRHGIHLTETIDWSSFKPTTPAGICFCGMGGSAIGGDLARSYWETESPIPLIVVRNYRLPAFVNEHWFIIATSYSGNTEETLAAVAEAGDRRCKRILALASGGELAAIAEQKEWPLITLPRGFMPRATLGYSFAATMVALAHWGVAGNNPSRTADRMSELIADSASFLERMTTRFGRNAPTSGNPAKCAAAALAGRTAVILGSAGTTEALALRVKSQLNENGKLFALASVLPEANHNEVVGLDALDRAADRPVVVLLSTGDEGENVIAQQRACVARLCQRGMAVIQLNADGTDRLQRMLYLVYLGDFISYYSAIVRGVDPTPILALEEIKASLKKSS